MYAFYLLPLLHFVTHFVTFFILSYSLITSDEWGDHQSSPYQYRYRHQI